MNQITKRFLLAVPMFLIEVFWFFSLYWWFRDYAAIITILTSALALATVLYIIMLRQESAYKLLWIITILGFPWIGVLAYLLFGNKRTARPLKHHLDASQAEVREYITKHNLPGYDSEPSQSLLKTLASDSPRISQTLQYVSQLSGFPILTAAETNYYGEGEAAWEQMLIDLRKAEDFIYVEYFIIKKGEMWNSIVEIMADKVKQGVDCRVLLDDIGSLTFNTRNNLEELQRHGIKCEVFNPVFIVRGTSNYRDHRKMLNIDGKVVYSGGINIADEYINKHERFKHWKDNCFRITGEPVRSYTRMYIEFWNAYAEDKIPLSRLAQNINIPSKKGLVLSYYDSPLDNREISNHLYIDLLAQATKTAYFTTPYLLLGDALLDSIILAAKRGVDVRIIMPGVPDKKYIYRMSQSYFRQLQNAGVKIYYYTPGFIHTKSAIFDNKIALAGSVNLDYRSLFLSFENNSVFYDCNIVAEIKDDFDKTFRKSKEVSPSDIPHHTFSKIHDGFIRLIAPLC